MDLEKLPPDRGPPGPMDLDQEVQIVNNSDVSEGYKQGESYQCDRGLQLMSGDLYSNQGENVANVINPPSNVQNSFMGNDLQSNDSNLNCVNKDTNNSQDSETNADIQKVADNGIRTGDNGTALNIAESEKQLRERFDELAKNKYRITDSGPYYVFIEHASKNLGRLFPIRVGHFLYQIADFRRSIKDIEAIGINRVKVVLDAYSVANKLIDHPVLIQNNLRSYIPKHFNHKKGLIKMVDTMFDDQYLLDNIRSDQEVVEIKRLRRRVVNRETGREEFVKRQMVQLTFLGSNIPDRVKINCCSFPVEPWVHPVVRCFKCLRFGHVSDQCKSDIRCSQCGAVGHNYRECVSEKMFCIFCTNDSHHSASKKCPAYVRQHNIKKIMAAENLSFKEAQYVADNPTYAKISTHNRFALLNNDENFPDLPKTDEQVVENAFALRKPKVNRPSQGATFKKRKYSDVHRTPIPSPSEGSISLEPATFSREPSSFHTPLSQYSQRPSLSNQQSQQFSAQSSAIPSTQTYRRESSFPVSDYHRIKSQIIKEAMQHFEILLKKLVPEETYSQSRAHEDINRFFATLLAQASNKTSCHIHSESQ